jgi:hypothetical protein
MAAENRVGRRHLINHGARTAALDGSELQSCHIIDISGTGARLKVLQPEALPDSFSRRKITAPLLRCLATG